MKPYTVVKSLAGRDSGRWFAALEISGEYVIIVDGKCRPLCRPKRKKAKHLLFTDRVLNGENLTTNRKIRSALKPFYADSDKGGK